MELNKDIFEELRALEDEHNDICRQLQELENLELGIRDRKSDLRKALQILRRQGFISEPEPLIREADPELERLLAEEEEIERQTQWRN